MIATGIFTGYYPYDIDETIRKTGEAGGPYVLTVKSGKESLHFVDVMLGEVWICAGQSNMEMPVSGFGFQEVAGARPTTKRATGSGTTATARRRSIGKPSRSSATSAPTPSSMTPPSWWRTM